MGEFHETIFLKDDSSLEDKYKRLHSGHSKNYYKNYRLDNYKKGIEGENQVVYHLRKSNVGMYVLRDINFEYEDLKAQIDFVVVTSHYCYFIECKNYSAKAVHVDEQGNFEMSGKNGRRGIPSPISQVEDQMTVFKKIYFQNQEKVEELLKERKFEEYFKTIVVFTNSEMRLVTKKAPYDIKHRVLKIDNLIRQIENDEARSIDKYTREEMMKIAGFILKNDVSMKWNDIETPTIDEKSYDAIFLDSFNETDYDIYEGLEKEKEELRKHDRSVYHNNQRTRKPVKNMGKDRVDLMPLLGFVLAIIVFIILMGNLSRSQNSNNSYDKTDYDNTQQTVQTVDTNKQTYKTIDNNTVDAIKYLKIAYDNSKTKGIDLYNYNSCVYLSKLFDKPFACIGSPMKVNFTGDNNLTINNTYHCYYLKYDLESKRILSATYEYVGTNNKCPGVDVGLIQYNTSNSYFTKIGGYSKILEMVRFAHNNNSGFDKYYDYNHIAERGGNPSLATTYKSVVDGYFRTISGKGFERSTDINGFNTMVEYYYYIMK